MSFHYRYGGSTAKRTLNCPGWVSLSKKLVDEGTVVLGGSSPHADRGSMLHEACEVLIKDNIEYEELLERGVEFNGVKLTGELLDTKIVPAIEALDELTVEYGIHKLVTEELVEVNDKIGGTIDIYAEGTDVLVFADYKFGEGIMVDATENMQLLFYGWSKLVQGGFDRPIAEYNKVVLAIIQPADRREEPLDVWEVPVQDLRDFGERFRAAVDIAEASKPGENLCTGDHCVFCPASGLNNCPAKANEANHNMKMLQKLDPRHKTDHEGVLEGPDDLPILDLDKSEFHTIDVVQALEIVEKLEQFKKDVRAFAIQQLELGAEVDGWKLVQKRAVKRWIDTDRTEKYLKRNLGAAYAVTTKVITPAQALKTSKLLDKKINLEKHVEEVSSGTTLARESDPREAVLVSSASLAEGLKQLEGGDDG